MATPNMLDAILVSDIGIHHNWLIQFCHPTRPDSQIGSMGFGPMGFGVAGVLGAKLAAADLGDAVQAAIGRNEPVLIDANIAADTNPAGAGVWELPGLGRSGPGIGKRFEP